jgi:ATP adenylyltransferase
MKTGLASTQTWEPLTDQLPAGQAKIPFTYFSAPISQKATPKQLHDTYMALHKLACYAVEKYIARNPDGGMSMDRELEKTGATPISYNLAFTDSVMVILPRRAEGMVFPTRLPEPEPQETGFVALNGTVLGGTLLVKDILEWDALRGDGGKLKMVLERIGIPFSAFQGEILGWKAVMPSQSL